LHLTREEERIYNGEHGWAEEKCMKILVRLGELFDATKLIPISSAHVSGVSYKTLGDPPIEYLTALASAKGRARVRATHNPHSFDEYLQARLEPNLRKKQLSILEQFERMRFTPSSTCTPYYLETPKTGSHLAWAESSAVVYANSVLGAWTNREGGPSALAAAIIGKTPDYGIHRAENRRSQVLVRLRTRLRSETEFGALGIHLGRILKDKIPAVEGIRGASEEHFKQLSAALATTGMVNMFHCRRTCRTQRRTDAEWEITVSAEDLKHTAEDLNTASNAKPDLVFIGCPHCSLNEVKQVAQLMEGRKVKARVEFWVCTSNHVKQAAKPHVQRIERGGGHVLADVCTVVSWTEALGIRTIMTNSAKTAYYAPTLNKAETLFATKEECLKTALEE
jgi:predicted aconitase